MKRFFTALLLRTLPALTPPTVVGDARASMRRAWASVAQRWDARPGWHLPEFAREWRLPELQFPEFRLPEFRLPELHLPELHLPDWESLKLPTLPSFPTFPRWKPVSVPEFPGGPRTQTAWSRGLFGLSLSLVLAPGQIQGFAAFCHLATQDLAPLASAAPVVHSIDAGTAASARTVRIAVEQRGLIGSVAAVLLAWEDSSPSLLPAEGPAAGLRLMSPRPVPGTFSGNGWESARVRGQRPPPAVDLAVV